MQEKFIILNPKKLAIKKGDHVIVETARGIEYGSVVANVQEVTDDKVVQPLKAVIRIANAEDDAKAARNKRKKKRMPCASVRKRSGNISWK